MMPYLSCKKIKNDVYNFPTWQYCKYKDIFDSRIIINSTAKFYISISYHKDLLSIDTRIFTPSYKSTISLVADIAYRMAALNPQLLGNVCRETDGVVLIDEVDLHLHPTWQQRILGDLTEIFPKVQFIVSTHAPAVINTVKSENIILLDDGMAYEPSGEVHGKDTNTIISGIMHSSERPMEIKALFQKFYHFIDCEEIENAEQILNQLKEKIGDDDSEIAGCNVKLKLLKVRRKR